MKNLFDSHCHIYDERYNEPIEEGGLGGFDVLISQIEKSNIKFIADIGTDVYTCRKVAENVEKYSFCYGVVGYYPGDVHLITDAIWDEVFGLYENNEKIVAIGEIGLDYHDPENYPDKETQQFWFRKQLRKAVELNAPVCIHSRDADQDSFNILKEEALGKIPVLLHCFSGSLELAKQYVKLGAYISIGGPVTFKNARHSAEVAANIPLDRLLIETDAPYLTPVPYRGKLNMPQYVEYTARKIAELRGISYEEVAQATFENACRFYRINA
ncbi:MAG: TatD family hydrolase [Clostridia bacterium]|nr:TatD family hydrolase [Clostridia bacterium]